MNRRRRPAFTMIELLVVIGIIVLLIGLLVPVISKVRTSAQTASVTNQMHKISAAIGNYFNDFQAYPGVLSNKDFTPSGNLSSKLGNGFGAFTNFANYTQSEDLVMALRGGFRLDASGRLNLIVKAGSKPSTPAISELDMGPISFNATAPGRKHAYIDPVAADYPPEDLYPNSAGDPPLRPVGGTPNSWAAVGRFPGLTYVIDSEAPEFMDLYSEPRPILYLRANPSATAGNIVYNSKIKGAFDPTFAYDLAAIQMYLQSSGKDDFHDPTSTAAGDTGFTGANLDPSKKTKGSPSRAWIVDYFTSPGGTSARGGGYLLLDAGADRVFGTDDDIIVGAGGGQ